MQNVYLINPPYKNKYFRDFYCSASSKAAYLWFPVDFIPMSAVLHQEFNVIIIDAIAEKKSADQIVNQIDKNNSKAVIILCGDASFDSDIHLANTIKTKNSKIKIILDGGKPLYEFSMIMENYRFVDGIVFDFTNQDVLLYIQKHFDQITNMVFRQKDYDKDFTIKKSDRRKEKYYSHPIPPHEKFSYHLYSYPGNVERRFAEVLTSYGCPFNCKFCNVTYSNIGFKMRHYLDILEELWYLKQLGIKEVLFKDPDIILKHKNYKILFQYIIEQKLNLKFSIAGTRVDLIDEESLQLFKRAGGHLIFFGVESGSDDVLINMNKQITVQKIRQAFQLCDRYKIRTGGFFILGLPTDTEQSMQTTIDLAKELNCYITSFNIAMPLTGSTIKQNYFQPSDLKKHLEIDISGGQPFEFNSELNAKTILKYKRKAVISFYLRPKYLISRIFKIKSFYELRSSLWEFIHIFF